MVTMKMVTTSMIIPRMSTTIIMPTMIRMGATSRPATKPLMPRVMPAKAMIWLKVAEEAKIIRIMVDTRTVPRSDISTRFQSSLP